MFLNTPILNTGNWTHFSSPVEHSPMQGFSCSPGFESLSPVNSNPLTGLASILPTHVSNPVKISPIGKDQGMGNSHINQMITNPKSPQASLYQHSHSFSDQKLSASPGPVSSFGESNPNNSSSIGTLSGPQFLWGSPTPYSEQTNSSGWPTSSVCPTFNYPNRHVGFLGHNQHHVGSAPSGVPLDRHFGYFPESPDTSFMSPVGFGGVGLNRNNGSYVTNVGTRGAPPSVGFSPSGNVIESGSPSSRMISFSRNTPIFYGNGSYQGIGGVNDGLSDRSRVRRVEYSGTQLENKKQYQLDLDKIVSGEDTRTTLMIKNIPNK